MVMCKGYKNIFIKLIETDCVLHFGLHGPFIVELDKVYA